MGKLDFVEHCIIVKFGTIVHQTETILDCVY